MSDTIRRLQEDRKVAGQARKAHMDRAREKDKTQRLQPERAADTAQLQSQFKMPYPLSSAISGQLQKQRQSGYIMPNDAARQAASMDGIYTPTDIPQQARAIEDQLTEQKAAEIRRGMAQSRPRRPVGIN